MNHGASRCPGLRVGPATGELANARNGILRLTCRSSASWIARGLIILAAFSALGWARQRAPRSRLSPDVWSKVAHALGVAGQIRGHVFRVNLAPPVNRVWMRRVRLAPGSIEPSWLTFGQAGALGWVMGRLVLPAPDGAAATGRLVHAGMEVTGMVDPLPGSSPALSAVYFHAEGDPVRLARQLKLAVGRMLRPLPGQRHELHLNAAAIEHVVRRRGEAFAGALVFRLARPETIKCCGLQKDPLLVFSGIRLVPASGLESRIAIQPDGTKAAVSGRFALLHGETAPVERALAAFGIQTVALDEPFSNEYPRISFLHFFGKGKPLVLAAGIRAAIERIHHLPPVKTP